MVKLTTFGGPGLFDGDGNRVEAVLAQPRRLALLTYLAVETRKNRLQRDVVLGMFWPEVSQIKASRSLSQAMHFLRTHLGASVLNKPGCGEMGVDPLELSCDVCRFLIEVETGRHASAVASYEGDFLRGFYVDDAPDFEEWVEEQRLYLRRQAAESALAAAREAVATGQPGTVAAYARRAAELGLFTEQLVREQMELLGSVGDCAGALQAFDDLRRRLNKELGVEPARETEELAVRLRQRAAGNASIPILARVESVPAGELAATQQRGHRTRQFLAVAGVTLIVGGGTLSLWGLSGAERTPQPDAAPVIQIEDFAELGTAPAGSGKAIVADVIGKLSNAPRLPIKYTANGSRVGKAGDANALTLTGYVTNGASPQSYQVSVTLLEGITGEGIAHRLFVYDSARFAAFDKVAEEIAQYTRTQTRLYARAEKLTKLLPNHASTIQLVQQYRERGDSLRGDGKAEAAIAAFDVADSMIAALQDQKKPLAMLLNERAEIWYARAWAFLTLEAYDERKFRESAQRSRILADSAVRLDPAFAEAHENAGTALYYLWQTAPAESAAVARHLGTQARVALREAVRLSPARARAWALLSAMQYNAGEYADARVSAEQAFAANAYYEESSDLLQRLVSTSLETDDPAAAHRWCAVIRSRFPGSWPAADCQVQLHAWSTPTRDDLRAATAVVTKFQTKMSQIPQLTARLEMALGVVAARAGMRADSAIALQAAAIRRSPDDPELAPMRAWLWHILDRPDSTRAVLLAYVAGDPSRRAGVSRSKRFRSPTQVMAAAR